ncbi:hypothetical protein LJ656_21370 [Paraburkholderia sp. MMS20-SJTR3]|uniref:Uncharacterized protein n=1 Tax=Paraburkholderia sejongensis TaxID=2886946 RepID=A0ABS8JZ14_9BURK|nr:hypothetical protein [Paraburkholderia sp. MMS20-SJTR3]MCC8395142.1 hypothetical protein [Paraburkholderia sp. MMS20-SJTR3]
MNEYEGLIAADAERPINLYSYGGRDDLNAPELYVAILTEELCKRLQATDIAAVIAFLTGQPILSTRKKFGGATPGTSLASLIARELLNFNLPFRVPTLTNNSIAALRFSMTRNLGAAVGRWTPQIGAAILIYDVVVINLKTTLRYNKLVKPEDRLSDGTVGTLG